MFNLGTCLSLSVLLVLIGMYGLFTRRSLVMTFLSIEVMLNGINISLVSFNYFRWGSIELSHYMYMLSIGVAAVEAAVGLAMVIVLFKNYHDVSRDRISRLGENG